MFVLAVGSRYIKFETNYTFDNDLEENINKATLFDSIDSLIDFCHFRAIEYTLKSFSLDRKVELVEVERTGLRELRRIS